MILISVLVAIIIFCLALAAYNFFEKDSIGVSRRIGSYVNKTSSKPKSEGSFWDDLRNSKYRDWAGEVAERFGHILPKKDYFDKLASTAGLPISGSELLVLVIGSSLIWFIILVLLFMGVYKPFVLSLLWFGMCIVYLNIKAEQRMKDFDNQLGDAIVMMNNALRAGFTFQQAMDTVAKELPDPVSGEFHRALTEVALGVPLEESLNGISQRMQSEDFDLVATAVVIQRQVGGNLSQILETIGTTIRDRVKLKREVKVLTAEGVFAGWIVGLLPVIVIVMLTVINPGYFDKFLEQSYAKFVIGACLVSEAIGAFVISRIVDVKV